MSAPSWRPSREEWEREERVARECSYSARQAGTGRDVREASRRQHVVHGIKVLSALWVLSAALCHAQSNLPPANPDGTCQPGYGPCLTGYDEAYQVRVYVCAGACVYA